ncbi:MAG: hypothetical protein ACRED5_22240 [Propylenella sp.]
MLALLQRLDREPGGSALPAVASREPPDLALANVMALRPQVGAYKDTPEEPEHWLIAEEVAEVDPALVGLKDGEPYTVKTYGVITDLVAVIQFQQRQNQAQQREIEAQRGQQRLLLAKVEAQQHCIEALELGGTPAVGRPSDRVHLAPKLCQIGDGSRPRLGVDCSGKPHTTGPLLRYSGERRM